MVLEECSQQERGPSSAIIVVPVIPWMVKFRRWLSTLQVSHHGYKYSIERLLALDEYTRKTPLWRALFVCVATPLPMVIVVLAQEIIPLTQPESDWRVNYGFWIRAAIIGGVVAHCMVIQMTYFFRGFTMSHCQMWQFSLCSAVGFVTTPAIIAKYLVFPIPFMILVVCAPNVVILVGSFRLIVGQQAFAEILARRDQLFRLMAYFSANIFLCFIYPAYQVLFNAVAGTRVELLMIIFIPVIKLTMQNIIARTMSHLEDMIPESVIFASDFFNAIYLATFMQESSSSSTMALIISIDVLQTVLVLVKLHQRISRIFSQLQQVEGNTNSKNNLLSQICSLCRNSFNKEAKEAIRRHSCIPHQISVEDTIFLASSGPLVDEEHKRFRINPPVNVVVPLDAAAFTFGKLGQNHCSSRDRLQTIERTLEVLFTSEFVVLTEYLEAIIPIFYGIFVLVMVHLPSARYHIELAGITCENVINIIQKLSLYALLEILSFIMLAVMMKRICKLRMLHHVAFVLETQMALIQIKMITWMLMTMSFRVVHFGVDFTFQFNWVADNKEKNIFKKDGGPNLLFIKSGIYVNSTEYMMRSAVTPFGGPNDLDSKLSLCAKFHIGIKKLKRIWVATQVSHRGKYSIERLLALEEYSRKTSLFRVLAVCAGTPLTIIVVVFSQGTLPLADPKDGWQANWGFWIRTSLLSGVTSVAVAVQLKYLVQGIDISSLQMILLSLSMALGYTGVSILVASLWVFPIPYMILSMMLPFLLLFVGATRVLFGSSTFQEILKKRKGLLRFVTAVSIQVLMAVCYPAYQLLFNTIAGSAYELPTFLLLPVIKMILKNFVSLCLAELADLIPENIIFTVHFFNAIYLATSMQSAASTIAIATIMFVDLLETGVALYGIYRSSKRIMEQLYQTIGPTSAGNNMLTAACSLCQCHDKFTREEHLQVKVRSSFCHPLSREGRDILNTLECDHNSPSLSLSSNTQSMPTIQNVLVVPSSSRYWSTSVLPYGPPKLNFIQATSIKRSHEKNAIAAVPSVQHITSLRKSLASLFTIECMVLAEYVEFIIPLLYGNYVLMMVRLPSAKYHSELSGVTIENAGSTVKTIFIYGLLEFGSFILLMMLLKRGCGMQALHHLAFVLETQMLPIQSKIIGWMLITLGFRVVHFGVDFTFQFSWIRNQNN